MTLLRRTTRRVDLTDAGAAYLDQARRILVAVDDAGLVAQWVQAGLTGRLVIGCVGSATYSLLPMLARSLREELPGVDCSFRGEMLVPDQVDALLAGATRAGDGSAALERGLEVLRRLATLLLDLRRQRGDLRAGALHPGRGPVLPLVLIWSHRIVVRVSPAAGQWDP